MINYRFYFVMAYWFIVFGILASCRTGLADNYMQHTLLQLTPVNEVQFDAVRAFEETDGLEILKRSQGLNDSLDVLVEPEKLEHVQLYASKHNLVMNVKTENYGRTLQFDRKPRRRLFNNFQYHSFAQINSALEALERSSNLIQLQKVGNSYKGQVIKLAKISSNPSANNPIIFVDAGIHAREWVAPAMALYMINRLVAGPTSKEDLDGVDWYILPVVNPDGYEFTRSSPDRRLWRKTMSDQTTYCFGVDGNRNYGFKWGVSGVSKNPCDRETYAGPRPFSEPETQIVRKIMLTNAKRIKLYVSMHAYGQYLVYPWGYTGDRLPATWKKLDNLARIVSAATVRAGGPPFKVLSAGKWYAAAGGSDDFAFGAVGIPYSYTMELTEGFEFVYPEELLPQVLPKFYEGFRAFKAEIQREFGQFDYRHKREVEDIFLRQIKNVTLI